MSTVKSSAENLTLNADGANNDVIIQSNASTKVTVDGQNSRVGIGTATPLMDLEVQSSGGATQIGISNTGSGQAGIWFDASNGDFSGSDYCWISQNNDLSFEITTGSLSNAPIIFRTNDGARARIDNDGLKFGADTAAANALDDYEEGTYTVAITMGSGTAAVDGSNNTLAYTKVGRLVTIGGQFRVGSVSSPDGSFGINLPFTSANGGEMYCSGTYRTYNIDTPNDGVAPVIHNNINQATATLEWSRDGSTPTEERATENGYFMIGLTYMAT